MECTRKFAWHHTVCCCSRSSSQKILLLREVFGYLPDTGRAGPEEPSMQNWLDVINIARFGHISAASSLHFDCGIMENHFVSLAITQQPHSSQPIQEKDLLWSIFQKGRKIRSNVQLGHTFIKHLIGTVSGNTSGLIAQVFVSVNISLEVMLCGICRSVACSHYSESF